MQQYMYALVIDLQVEASCQDVVSSRSAKAKLLLLVDFLLLLAVLHIRLHLFELLAYPKEHSNAVDTQHVLLQFRNEVPVTALSDFAHFDLLS